MLSNPEKHKLRKIAQGRRALFQMGKEGVTPNLIKTLKDSLEAHEIVKISMLKTCPADPREAALDISAGTHSEIVQVIGRTFILYRRSKKNKLEM